MKIVLQDLVLGEGSVNSFNHNREYSWEEQYLLLKTGGDEYSQGKMLKKTQENTCRSEVNGRPVISCVDDEDVADKDILSNKFPGKSRKYF